MKHTLLVAALSTVALAGCSADRTDPLAPDLALSLAVTAGGVEEGARDALDRVVPTLDGKAVGRLRAALQRVAAGAENARAVQDALAAVDALELEGGASVGAEADAIRLALGAQ